MMTEQTDEQVVSECLQGNQDAWVRLIRRYRQLIYAVIRSYHFSDHDSADIFQSVCLELFHNLPHLREVGALRRWLITVSSHQCFRWKKSVRTSDPDATFDIESVPDDQTAAHFAELERRQILRQAMDQLPSRCREMIRLLFLMDPPMPYAEVAVRLGLAAGSIGFIRRGCLNTLKLALEKLGF